MKSQLINEAVKENGLSVVSSREICSIEKVNDLADNAPVLLIDMQLGYLLETLKPGQGIWLTDPKFTSAHYAKLPLSHGTPEKMTTEEFIESDCDPRDLALVFHACYERSGGGREDLEKRADAAKEWYKHFTGIDLDS